MCSGKATSLIGALIVVFACSSRDRGTAWPNAEDATSGAETQADAAAEDTTGFDGGDSQPGDAGAAEPGEVDAASGDDVDDADPVDVPDDAVERTDGEPGSEDTDDADSEGVGDDTESGDTITADDIDDTDADGSDADPPLPGWEIAGDWPTYGFSHDQTRRRVNPGASLRAEPAVAWTLSLPIARHSMWLSSATIGEAGRLYVPFFGIWAHYPAGGVQAIDAAGRPAWYFTARETEAQAPLLVRDRVTDDTVVVFGSAGRPWGDPLFPDSEHHYPSLIAIYDKDECRCCVHRDEAATACDFACVADELCEPYDPDSPYEWPHTAHVDSESGTASCEHLDPECAAWLVSSDELDPAQVPRSPNRGYYEACTTPMLSPDGLTVYHPLCGVDVPHNLTNLIVAMDVQTRSIKWVLTEDDPAGWDGGECSSGHNQLGWITAGAMFSDGSILLGTRAGCLVRIVDNGTSGATVGVYRGLHPSVLGVTVEPTGTGDDHVYVATHGQNRFQPGDLYKTSRDRLSATGDDHAPIWSYAAGEDIAPEDWFGDAPGLFGSPMLAEVDGRMYVYGVVAEWPAEGRSISLNPDRGWIIRVPADGPDGSEIHLPLQLGEDWYPAYGCTMDGSGQIWIHGGLNRAVDGSGRILRTDPNLSSLAAITDGVLPRFGYSEIVLGSDYMYAVSSPSWDGDDDVMPVVYRLE